MAITKAFQITAQLAEFGEFEQVGLPELDITIDDYYAPGARTPQKLFGTGKYSDVSLSRAYDPSRDSRVEDWVKRVLRGQDGSRIMTVFVLNDQNGLQQSRTYKVVPQGAKAPDGKSGDGSIAMFTVKLAVEEENI